MSGVLAEALDGAQMVRYNEARGLLVAWYGGNLLHVVDFSGTFVNAITNVNISDSVEAFAHTMNVFKDGWHV